MIDVQVSTCAGGSVGGGCAFINLIPRLSGMGATTTTKTPSQHSLEIMAKNTGHGKVNEKVKKAGE